MTILWLLSDTLSLLRLIILTTLFMIKCNLAATSNLHL